MNNNTEGSGGLGEGAVKAGWSSLPTITKVKVIVGVIGLIAAGAVACILQ